MNLMECIKLIPEKTKLIFDEYETMKLKLEDAYTDDLEGLVIVGSGSSYNTGLILKHFIQSELGLKVELHLPNDFVNFENLDFLKKNTIYVFLSQSGMTTLVVEAEKMVREKGFKTVSFTENPDSILSLASDYAFDIQTDKEKYRFRTVGVTNTVLSLLLSVIAVSRNIGRISESQETSYLKTLKSNLDNLEQVRIDSEAWFYDHIEKLSQCETFIFTAAGSNWPIVKEAEIKFMEMLPALTQSFELEELVHGPQNAFGENQGFFILADENTQFEKAKQTQKFIEEAVGARVFLIEENTIPSFPKLNKFSFLTYLMFFQTQAYHIAITKGRDLRFGTYPSVDEYIGRTIKKEENQ